MAELTSWCRGCSSLCGVLASTADGRLERVRGDSEHPLSRGFDCAHGRSAPHQVNRADRLRAVLRADGSGDLTRSSWDLALDDLGSVIQAVVRQQGWRGVGLMLGGGAQHSGRLRRTIAALQERLGPLPVFTCQARERQPMAHAARLVLGRTEALRADLARVQHLLLLGGNQLDQGWAPGHAGQTLLQRLDGSSRGRLHLSVADARTSRLATRARAHLAIRPGTDLYLLLGMAAAMIRSEWLDAQHVRERTRGFEQLTRAMEPWTPARAAELCGLSVADINAEAMRFSRAPTAAILASPQALGTPWSTLTAWVILVLHALTSNLLEPGGLYAHPGSCAPPVSVSERADTELVVALGQGLRVLICIEADPLGSLPKGASFLPGDLERLVCVDRVVHSTARSAHWVLPSTHFLEEPDLGLSDACDRHWLQWSPGLVVQPPECQPPWEIVARLMDRGAPHPQSAGGILDHARLEQVAVVAAARSLGVQADELDRRVRPQLTRTGVLPRGFDGGPVDRARWAVHHGDRRLQLAPEPMLEALAHHQPSAPSERWPSSLLSSARRDPARGPWERCAPAGASQVGLHPQLGFEAGQAVRVVSSHGSTAARVVLDAELHPGAVDLPAGTGADPMALVEPTHLDRWAGTAWTDGQPCRVELVGPVGSVAAPKPLA